MKILLLSIAVLCFVSCKKEVVQVSIKEDVAFLSSDDLAGRETGTKEELMAAKYIKERMEAIGLIAKGQAGTYFQTFTFRPSTNPHEKVKFIDAGDGTTTGTNVIGYIDNNAAKTVIIGAHYDHLGYGGQGSLHRGSLEVHNGADDNASGVAMMLKLAERLTNQNTGHNYLFIAFSGEEMGLLGSNYFAKNPTVDLSKANYMLNMDMVGRLREDKALSISGVGTTPLWKQILNSNNTGFKLVLNESGIGPSDHTSFYLQNIPALHFFTGQHEDYHKPSDDHQKLNYDGMKMITDYIFNIISDLDASDKLVFKKTKNESEEVPRFKVALGVVPDYLFDGVGMRIDGVSEGKPAEKAGLQKGDIVIKLGDMETTDMMSYMKALTTFQKGDTTKVVVDRKGKRVEATIVF
ncbi:M28 family peptidase [Sungkyunkwania multivorans]|uniref:M28 family peptidase n=1 Tax=Sungkyunkwania multivorans TaxID=1173618 RepID=A0ABW3CZE7_9FLAO